MQNKKYFSVENSIEKNLWTQKFSDKEFPAKNSHAE